MRHGRAALSGLPPARDRGLGGVLASLALAAAMSLAACGSSGTSGPSSTLPAVAPSGVGAPPSATAMASPPASVAPSSSPAATAVAPAPALASPLTGVVISVDSTGLAQVTGFTLRLPDGTVQAFRIGVLENGAEFPPGHLKEHAVSAAPVRVFFRPEGPDLVAYRIEDAG